MVLRLRPLPGLRKAERPTGCTEGRHTDGHTTGCQIRLHRGRATCRWLPAACKHPCAATSVHKKAVPEPCEMKDTQHTRRVCCEKCETHTICADPPPTGAVCSSFASPLPRRGEERQGAASCASIRSSACCLTSPHSILGTTRLVPSGECVCTLPATE